MRAPSDSACRADIPARPPAARRGLHRPLALAAALATLATGLLAACGRSTRPAATADPARRSPGPQTAASATRVPASEPGGGRTLFPSHRLVMFYGAAGTPALGVLGAAPPETMWRRLAATSRQYDRPNVVTVPTYELIAWVAKADPGPDGSYAARVPDATIARYYAVAHAHHGLLVLDVQPGRHDFLPLAKTLRRWLAKPDVGLALDPEWKLYGDQVPGQRIGDTDAASVNAVSAWLSRLVAAHDLPQKLLLVHNFTGQMIRDERRVAFRDNVALAENADGFGTRGDKLGGYRRLATDPRMWLGFKLFYRQDIDLFSPAELLEMPDPPSIVDYQ